MKLGTVKQKKKIFPGAMRSFSPIFTNRSIRKDGEKIFIHQFLIPDIYEGIEGVKRNYQYNHRFFQHKKFRSRKNKEYEVHKQENAKELKSQHHVQNFCPLRVKVTVVIIE